MIGKLKTNNEIAIHWHRMLLGAGNLRSWLYTRRQHDDGLCPHCGGEEDLDHVLFRCPNYRIERDRLHDQQTTCLIRDLQGHTRAEVHGILNRNVFFKQIIRLVNADNFCVVAAILNSYIRSTIGNM